MTGKAVFVVDDNPGVRASIEALLDAAGYESRIFDSAKGVLDDPGLARAGCLIADIRMPDMDGLTLQEEILKRKILVPIIIITGHGDVPLAVRAMKAGAKDFIEKPFDGSMLLASVDEALSERMHALEESDFAKTAKDRMAALSARERDVLQLIVEGEANKTIAYKLGISHRTVEIHRSRVMEKMQCRSVSELVRLALAGGITVPGHP